MNDTGQTARNSQTSCFTVKQMEQQLFLSDLLLQELSVGLLPAVYLINTYLNKVATDMKGRGKRERMNE